MPSIKDLKKRISVVKNTQQTTRAMKMVSAAKLRRAQEAILAQRPYARRLDALLRKVSMNIGMEALAASSPWLNAAKAAQDGTETAKKILLVLCCSDRGLCGGFNSNVIKMAQRWTLEARSNGHAVTLAFVGKKGNDFFKMRSDYQQYGYFPEFSGKVSYLKAKGLAAKLQASFAAGEFDAIHVIYNEFKNAVSQKVVVEQFLPLSKQAVEASAGEVHAWSSPIIIKQSPQAVFDGLMQKHFSTQAFRILLESQASEHGARMSAMENATKNAGEMIRKLTLQFNKQRQAGITKELLEIISGSESQKQA